MSVGFHKMRATISAAQLADYPVAEALKVLASMPEARTFKLAPEELRRILLEGLPEQYAASLFERAGYRVEVSLADLAYLARYDDTLAELVSSIILYLTQC